MTTFAVTPVSSLFCQASTCFASSRSSIASINAHRDAVDQRNDFECFDEYWRERVWNNVTNWSRRPLVTRNQATSTKGGSKTPEPLVDGFKLLVGSGTSGGIQTSSSLIPLMKGLARRHGSDRCPLSLEKSCFWRTSSAKSPQIHGGICPPWPPSFRATLQFMRACQIHRTK